MVKDLGTKTAFDNGNDDIVIRKDHGGIIGGKVLDLEGFTPDVIHKGHVIIRNTARTIYKPMPVVGNAYGSLPGGYEYVGVSRTTALASEPIVGILTDGEVNDVASPYPVDAIKAAIQAATKIVFEHD